MNTLITNVTIIDGTGSAAREGELLFGDGVVKQVAYRRGEIGAGAAATTFDGRGLTLAPGFIDAHGHSDLSILAAPEAVGKISQGITTEISGNCGLSPFPITDLNREHLETLWKNYGEKLTWNDFAGYRRELVRRNVAINLYSLCGHNTLRAAVAGYETRDLSRAQLDRMRVLLLDALQHGAAGFSTGLLYSPGVYSSEAELLELAKVLAPFLRVYTTHLRSEGAQLLESVAESVRLCRGSGQRYLHISHLKTAGAANHYKIGELLEMIDRENADGNLAVTADRYPYVESLTQLSVALPPPYDRLDDVAVMSLLADPEKFSEAAAALASRGEDKLDSIRLVSTGHRPFQRFIGMKFIEIGNICFKPASLIIAELLKADATGSMAAFCGMSMDNLRRILRRKYVACGTDESARPLGYELGVSHPRGFGSMPKFMQMLMEEDFSLESALARMTSLPARIFNLSNRGVIAPDMAADMVLFDPDRFHSEATFAKPHTPASGVHTVWVNGRIRYQHSQNRGDILW
ncbi:MAG: amidohydrolase family protein [Victivallaceae bacterium]|nr:amidohydrolase family protein [Victivallaceae bacterium]